MARLLDRRDQPGAHIIILERVDDDALAGAGDVVRTAAGISDSTRAACSPAIVARGTRYVSCRHRHKCGHHARKVGCLSGADGCPVREGASPVSRDLPRTTAAASETLAGPGVQGPGASARFRILPSRRRRAAREGFRRAPAALAASAWRHLGEGSCSRGRYAWSRLQTRSLGPSPSWRRAVAARATGARRNPSLAARRRRLGRSARFGPRARCSNARAFRRF